MSDLQLFQNPEFGRVRIVEVDCEAWMVGKDVAEALGYSNPQKAIRDHVDEDDKTVNESFTVNGTQGALINESGLYSLVLSSKLPNARKFRRWVTTEVLPTVRKHGAYMTPETLHDPGNAASGHPQPGHHDSALPAAQSRAGTQPPA